jgi:hypothetical protein
MGSGKAKKAQDTKKGFKDEDSVREIQRIKD